MSRDSGPEAFSRAVRRGLTVTVALTMLTIVEYLIAVNVGNPLIPLLPFVAAKGWLILDYFMHIKELRQESV
jgi:hypothetical protein